MELAFHTIRGHQPGPRLLITGGVHGDEFEPMAAIRRLIRDLRPADIRGELTLIPVVNEAAFVRGSRTAEDERDLARTCPGKADGSITERIAFAVTQYIQRANFYIDLHTGGTRLRVTPMSGYSLVADEAILNTQRRMARAFGLPIIWGTDPNLQGRTLSVARDARVPAIYTEYQGGGACDPTGVEAYVRGCLNVMSELGLRDIPPEPMPQPLVVEDRRPSSGHMQICLPAPRDGFFEPAVELGQRVRQGDVFGTVTNVLGDQTDAVLVPHDGIVLVLHTFSRVAKDVGLGVVLEV